MKDKISYKSSDKCLGKKFLRFITMSDKSADVQKSKKKKKNQLQCQLLSIV